MDGGYKIRDQHKPHYLTFTVVNWIDLFTRKEYKDILIDSMAWCQKNKGLRIFAYVIMTNHMHLIAGTEDEQKLSNIIRDLKRHTSSKILQAIEDEGESRREWMLKLMAEAAAKHKRNKKYQVWMHHNHPIELFSNKFIWQRLEYIHDNPLRAGIVENSWDYMYSSARNYAGMDYLMKVEEITLPVKTVR